MHKKTIVQLQIYSGKRNPQWLLNEQQIETFNKFWNDAEIEEQKIKLPSKLGYQGFVVYNDLYRWIIYDGHIHCMDDTFIETKKDTRGRIELFLKSTIPKQVIDVAKEIL